MKRTTLFALLASFVTLTFVSDAAFAQRRRSGGFLGAVELIGMEEVQAELKITDEQKEKLSEVRRALLTSDEARGLFRASDEERPKMMAALRAKASEQLKGVLQPDQHSRLNQLYVQRQGYRILRDETYAADLKLTDDQKAQITKLMDESDKARSAVRFDGKLDRDQREAKMAELSAARDAKLASLLSDTQKKSLEAKKGAAFVFVDQQPRTTETKTAGTTTPAGGTTTPATTGTTATPTGSETVATGGMGDPVLSFGGTVKLGQPVKELTFNFRHAPWLDVLKMFAAAAGLTLDANKVPPGTFDYYDDKKYTPVEALDVINGYLLQKGFVLVNRDKFLVVVAIDDGIPPVLIPIVGVDELPKRGKNELLTVHFPVEGITAKDAATEVGELVGPHGTVVGLSAFNKLVVTDTGQNLRRIHQLLSGVTVDGDRVFKRFNLEYINVADAEILVRQLFGLPTGVADVSSGSYASRYGYSRDSRYSSSRSSSSSSSSRSSSSTTTNSKDSVNVATDERTNALLVTASPENMKIAEDAIKAIDVEGNGTTRRSNEPYLEVYQLKSATASEVAKTLGVLYPGMVVNEDSRSGRIHIQATPDMQEKIAASIKRLDGAGAGSEMRVIPLGRLDSYTATASIQSLFLLDVEPPIVQPHPTSNALIIRGQMAQIEQIQELLSAMDPSEGNRSGGNIRDIPLGGRDPKEVMKILEEMINRSGKARIRTVIPSRTGPIKNRRIPSIDEKSDLDEPKSSGTGLIPLNLFQLNSDSKKKAPAKTEPKSDSGDQTPKNSKSAQQIRQEKFDAVFATFREEKAPYEEKVEKRAPLFRNVSQQQVADEGKADGGGNQAPQDINQPKSNQENPAPAQESANSDANAGDQSDVPNILLTIRDGNLVAISTDQGALDSLEDTVDALAEFMPVKPQWTVFYLQSADATETSTVLERLFPTSSVSTTSSSGGGGLLGELTGGLSSMGRGLMNMSGLDMLTSSPTTLRIIPDTRTNSLFVSGPPHLVDEVEETLAILDASELPEQLRQRAPRYIEVKHADVNEVADMIRDVYKEEMQPPQQQGRGGGGSNPLAAMMGMGGRGGSSRGGSSGGANRIRLTLGVDTRNSRLIVSASEPLFVQIQGMVTQIDEASLQSRRTTRIIPLKNANTAVLKATLGALVPKVRISSSSTSSRSSSSSSSSRDSSSSSSRSSSTPQPSQDQIREAIRARMGLGGSSSSSRSPFGGGSSSRGFGGRGFGGDSRGFGGRGPGGRGGR